MHEQNENYDMLINQLQKVSKLLKNWTRVENSKGKKNKIKGSIKVIDFPQKLNAKL